MSGRIKLKEVVEDDVETEDEPRAGLYFTKPSSEIEFFSSGCTLLDCVLGGGWALGRVSNVVGDKSTGKTLLAIEACANFRLKYPNGKIWYCEAEAAFDEGYASALGMPVDSIDFKHYDTVEDVFEHLDKILENGATKEPFLYIVDSLDALSDRTEIGTPIGKQDYPRKPRTLGRLFRELIRKVQGSQGHIMVVSQVRENIGVTFGEHFTRTGGKALDFYCSQAIWLAKLKQLTRTIRGVERVVGLRILANCKKNKVSLPHRKCEFKITFGYGIEDLESSAEWLTEIKRAKLLGVQQRTKESEMLSDYYKKTDRMSHHEYRDETMRIAQIVKNEWYEIEKDFMTIRGSKY